MHNGVFVGKEQGAKVAGCEKSGVLRTKSRLPRLLVVSRGLRAKSRVLSLRVVSRIGS